MLAVVSYVNAHANLSIGLDDFCKIPLLRRPADWIQPRRRWTVTSFDRITVEPGKMSGQREIEATHTGFVGLATASDEEILNGAGAKAARSSRVMQIFARFSPGLWSCFGFRPAHFCIANDWRIDALHAGDTGGTRSVPRVGRHRSQHTTRRGCHSAVRECVELYVLFAD